MWQAERSTKKEILDLDPSHYTQDSYDRCLSLLCRINSLLGGFSSTKSAFKALSRMPKSILDVGCGGGYLCQKMHRWFPKANIVGIDLNKNAVAHSEMHLPENMKGKVSFNLQMGKSLDYPNDSFDVVTTMLVCHHMTDEELVEFLQESYRISSLAVIINDLHRHFLAYLAFTLIAPFAFPSWLIWHDGRLSIRRSFRKRDWIRLMEKAGFHQNQYVLKWHFPFRWTLTLEKG